MSTDAAIQLECTPMAVIRKLGKTPYRWQDAVLRDCMPKFAQVALRAANESGKTSVIIVALVMWHLLVFPRGTVVITSGTWRQVQEQVFAALNKQADRFPGFQFLENKIIGPEGGMVMGFSTDDPGKFEGWHAEDHDDAPLLIIVDEAKSVSDAIHTAISRCRPTRLVEMSSPGRPVGAFHRIHTSESQGWKHHLVTAYDCPHIPPELIASDIAKYGKDHPLIRSMIFADWMTTGDGEQFVLNWQKLEAVLKAPPLEIPGDVSAFCDFAVAEDGDECTLVIRRGNKIEIAAAWQGSGDTVREAHRFVQLFKQHRLKPEEIAGDSAGIGHAYCDMLAEMGWPIRRVNNVEASTQPKRYANLGAEMWFEGAAIIEAGQVILPPDDDKLKLQLTGRRYETDDKGRLKLVSKKKAKTDKQAPSEFATRSPDRADGVMGVLRSFARDLKPVDLFKGDMRHMGLAEMAEHLDTEPEGASWFSSSV